MRIVRLRRCKGNIRLKRGSFVLGVEIVNFLGIVRSSLVRKVFFTDTQECGGFPKTTNGRLETKSPFEILFNVRN